MSPMIASTFEELCRKFTGATRDMTPEAQDKYYLTARRELIREIQGDSLQQARATSYLRSTATAFSEKLSALIIGVEQEGGDAYLASSEGITNLARVEASAAELKSVLQQYIAEREQDKSVGERLPRSIRALRTAISGEMGSLLTRVSDASMVVQKIVDMSEGVSKSDIDALCSSWRDIVQALPPLLRDLDRYNNPFTTLSATTMELLDCIRPSKKSPLPVALPNNEVSRATARLFFHAIELELNGDECSPGYAPANPTPSKSLDAQIFSDIAVLSVAERMEMLLALASVMEFPGVSIEVKERALKWCVDTAQTVLLISNPLWPVRSIIPSTDRVMEEVASKLFVQFDLSSSVMKEILGELGVRRDSSTVYLPQKHAKLLEYFLPPDIARLAAENATMLKFVDWRFTAFHQIALKAIYEENRDTFLRILPPSTFKKDPTFDGEAIFREYYARENMTLASQPDELERDGKLIGEAVALWRRLAKNSYAVQDYDPNRYPDKYGNLRLLASTKTALDKFGRRR